MRSVAIIFGGGTGQRMGKTTTPKQFLVVDSKPVIVHTIEHFQKCEMINNIVVVCLSSFVQYMWELVDEYKLVKVVSVVEGGASGQESIFNGLKEATRLYGQNDDVVVLIHDAVRPLIDDATILNNIDSVKKFGSSITINKAKESVALVDKNEMVTMSLKRDNCYIARAPQSFFLKDIYAAHLKAREENNNAFVDSCELMRHYGYSLHCVEGPEDNIKITTPIDMDLFKLAIQAKQKNVD